MLNKLYLVRVNSFDTIRIIEVKWVMNIFKKILGVLLSIHLNKISNIIFNYRIYSEYKYNKILLYIINLVLLSNLVL